MNSTVPENKARIHLMKMNEVLNETATSDCKDLTRDQKKITSHPENGNLLLLRTKTAHLLVRKCALVRLPLANNLHTTLQLEKRCTWSGLSRKDIYSSFRNYFAIADEEREIVSDSANKNPNEMDFDRARSKQTVILAISPKILTDKESFLQWIKETAALLESKATNVKDAD